MSIKQIIYIADDFSSNSVEYYASTHGNLTFFDYTDFQIERHWDFSLDGIADYFEVIADYGSAYRPVVYDNHIEWLYSIDNDYYTDWTIGYHASSGLWGGLQRITY